MSDRPARIVRIADHPALVPIVSAWLWEAFWRHDGATQAETAAWLANATATKGPPQAFLALEDAAPVAVATLVEHDLDQRPDLTPWLANVFVTPAARGRGHARRLVRQVEQAAIAAGIRTLWLYTWTAEGLYVSLGWQTVETFVRHGEPHKLMRRNLSVSSAEGVGG